MPILLTKVVPVGYPCRHEGRSSHRFAHNTRATLFNAHAHSGTFSNAASSAYLLPIFAQATRCRKSCLGLMIGGHGHPRIEQCTTVDNGAASFLEPLRGCCFTHDRFRSDTEGGGQSVSRSPDRLLVQSMLLLIPRHLQIVIHVTLGVHEVIRGRIDRCRLHLRLQHLFMVDRRNLLLSLLLWHEDATGHLSLSSLMQTMTVSSSSCGIFGQNMMLID